MAFLYLLLGHLAGDFVLQTDRIAENKARHWQWNLLHVLVVTLCTLVFSYPFGFLLLALVLFNGLIHFALDYFKPVISRRFHLSELTCFLFDQLVHIMLLYFISLSATYRYRHLVDPMAVRFLIVLVLVTSFSAVFTQFILAAVFPRNGSRFFEKGEKHIGILTRIYVTVVLYLTLYHSPYYLLLMGIAAAAFFIQFRLGWNKWMSAFHLIVKLLLDTGISALCIFLIIFL